MAGSISRRQVRKPCYCSSEYGFYEVNTLCHGTGGNVDNPVPGRFVTLSNQFTNIPGLFVSLVADIVHAIEFLPCRKNKDRLAIGKLPDGFPEVVGKLEVSNLHSIKDKTGETCKIILGQYAVFDGLLVNDQFPGYVGDSDIPFAGEEFQYGGLPETRTSGKYNFPAILFLIGCYIFSRSMAVILNK